MISTMNNNPVRRRPRTASERIMLKWAAYPPIQRALSSALRKPVFPRDIYVSENAKYVHYSVADKALFDPRSFRVIRLGEHGTKGIVGCPKGQWDDILQRCRVGTRLQSILVPVERLERAVRAFIRRKARYAENPTIMTVMNPSYGNNPVDIEYDPESKQYHVYRTNPGGGSGRYNVYLVIDGIRRSQIAFSSRSRARAIEFANARTGAGIEAVVYRNRKLVYHTGRTTAEAIAWAERERREREMIRRLGGVRDVSPTWFLKAYPGEERELPPEFRKLSEDEPPPAFMNNPYVSKEVVEEVASFKKNPWEMRSAYPTVFNNNPADLATSVPYAAYDKNPVSPGGSQLIAREYDKLMDRPVGTALDNAARHDARWRYPVPGRMALNPDHGPYCKNPCCNPCVEFSSNPVARFKIGDWVRNLKRVEIGNEIKLEKGQLGVIAGVGSFMGDTLYSVEFYTPHGTKTFKFFDKEIYLAREGWTSNPGPSDLSGYRRPPLASDVNVLSRQPSGRPAFRPMRTRKARIPIRQFEDWLRRHGSRDEWMRYQKEKAAYRRFHKGAEPTFVTRRIVDVGAGKKLIGRAFGYSMGKSPFEPYITPKGSGKGTNKPYLHEYETMPEGITNSSGRVVIKPLEGRTKITDWIHY